jgi:hypothetical protein
MFADKQLHVGAVFRSPHMSTIYPPIVTQQIPESVLTATLGYLGDLARNPRYPAPAGGYNLVHSRKNAASIKSHILRAIHPTPPAGSGWEYGAVDTISSIPFGHHLVLCPLNSESQPINWLNDQGVPLRCWADGALSDAGEVANRLVDYLDEQEAAAGTGITWARSIASSDGHSARRESIHVHIVLTPRSEILSALGLGLRPFVDPRIIQARDE